MISEKSIRSEEFYSMKYSLEDRLRAIPLSENDRESMMGLLHQMEEVFNKAND